MSLSSRISKETKHKKHQTRSLETIKAKLNDKSQGAWKNASTHYITLQKERTT
jgi:hypothetical protein